MNFFFKNHVTKDEIWTLAGTREIITRNFEYLLGIFSSTFKLLFKTLVVRTLMFNCWQSTVDSPLLTEQILMVRYR